MAVQWAPDYSTFTTNQNAKWMTNPGDVWEGGAGGWTGFGVQEAGDPWEGTPGQWKQEQSGSGWQDLHKAGAWDLSNTNTDAWKYLAKNSPGHMTIEGETFGDDYSLYAGLGKIGAHTPEAMTQALVAGGWTPEQAQAQVQKGQAAAERNRYLMNKGSHGGISGIVHDAGDFAGEALKNFILPSLMMYGGVAGLGGLFGAAAPAIGPGATAALGTAEGSLGATIGGMSEGAAWGAGLGSGSADLAAMETAAFGGASGGPTGIAGATGGSSMTAPAIENGLSAELAAGAPEAGGGAMFGGTTGAGELTSPDWLSSLMAETGELGQLPGVLESGFNAAGGTDIMGGLAGMWNQFQDPLKLVGALSQMMNSGSQADELKAYLAKAQGQGFDHRKYDPMAEAFADPIKRREMMMNTPGYQESQRFLTDAMQRKLASQGTFMQQGQGGAVTNNWAVPMADVVAKNAMDWDKQLFGQIQGYTGMGFDDTGANAQLAGAFLPAAMNQQNKAYDALFEALRSNKNLIPDALKGLESFLS